MPLPDPTPAIPPRPRLGKAPAASHPVTPQPSQPRQKVPREALYARIPADTMRRLKLYAVMNSRSVQDVTTDAIEEWMQKHPQ